MNIQPMIDELLLIRRGLGKVGYSQSTFGTREKKHPCGTVCCMAGIAAYKRVGMRYLDLSGETVADMGAEMLGIFDPDDNYAIFSAGSDWPALVWLMYKDAKDEQTRIDAAICALRLMNSKGNFNYGSNPEPSLKRQKRIIAQRLAEVAQEEQELSELGKLLKEVELEINSPEPDKKLLRKASHEQKKLPKPSRTGRKLVATQTKP
jgi:hypothetical protein